tara:strand:- start:29188 stop:29469 length:282 start_codon:yes stop_codon:yes gene_type:complete
MDRWGKHLSAAGHKQCGKPEAQTQFMGCVVFGEPVLDEARTFQKCISFHVLTGTMTAKPLACAKTTPRLPVLLVHSKLKQKGASQDNKKGMST